MRVALPASFFGALLACACSAPNAAPEDMPRADPRGASPPAAQASSAAGGPATVPAEWSACQRDDECTFVSLGCCSTTPVHRAFSEQAKAALEASGARFCPVKQLCGPGVDGTFTGAPGTCVAGHCACDPDTPLVDNCLGK